MTGIAGPSPAGSYVEAGALYRFEKPAQAGKKAFAGGGWAVGNDGPRSLDRVPVAHYPQAS